MTVAVAVEGRTPGQAQGQAQGRMPEQTPGRMPGQAPSGRHGRPPGGPERLYVITGGRSGAGPATRLDLVTLIVATAPSRAGRIPEHAAILRMCRHPLSVAEISAHLRLPFSATAVLITDLLAVGLVAERQPVKVGIPDPELLKEVIRGLRRL